MDPRAIDLVERYLHAVRVDLRRSDADDIVAEIRADLESHIDALAAAGRSGADQIVALLRRYGDPRLVAARYSEHPSLIGPALLPFYWRTIRIVATVVVASLLAGGLIGGAGRNDASIFLRSLGYAWNAIFIVAGVVTVAFATMERVATPQRLPLDRLGMTRWDPLRLAEPSAHSVSYTTSLVDIIANGLVLLFLLDVCRFRDGVFALVVPGAQDWTYAPTAAWQPLFVAVLVGSAALTVAGFATFLRPNWSAQRAGVYAVAHAGIVVGAALTLRAGQLVAPTDPTLEALGRWSIVAFMCGAALVEAVYVFQWLRRSDASRGMMPGLLGHRS